MHKFLASVLVLWLVLPLAAQTKPAPAAAAPPDISGMYTFLREGEFVEIDVDSGKVSGFVSRYGDSESDRGAFLDQLIDKGSLEGKNLSFTTRAVHGVSFEFKGTVERGEGKVPGAEAYYVIKGTLTQITTDGQQKTTAKNREVVFKSFPADATLDPARKKD